MWWTVLGHWYSSQQNISGYTISVIKYYELWFNKPFLITETWASTAKDIIKDILNYSDFLIITENMFLVHILKHL